jgi:hypothetical protein
MMEEGSMDEPEVVQAAEVVPADGVVPVDEVAQDQEVVQGGPKSRYPNLLYALIVAIAGVLGQILVYTLPGDDFGNFKLLTSLGIVAQALMFLGVIWLGVLLAYWGILKSRR